MLAKVLKCELAKKKMGTQNKIYLKLYN